MDPRRGILPSAAGIGLVRRAAIRRLRVADVWVRDVEHKRHERPACDGIGESVEVDLPTHRITGPGTGLRAIGGAT